MARFSLERYWSEELERVVWSWMMRTCPVASMMLVFTFQTAVSQSR